MIDIPAITEADIECLVGDRSFGLGQDYAADGAIFDTRRQGLTLKARCQGTSGGPYRVEVTLADAGIASASCSCPVGGAGTCKHVAALLLTWLDRPEEFIEFEDLDTELGRHGKAELIALIKQMVLRQPELESLLQVPLPEGGRRAMPVDPAVYRRQAAAAFRGLDHEWGAESEAASSLYPLTAIGDGFVAQADYASASAVYVSVLAETIEHYEEVSDEGNDLDDVIGTCVAGLGTCLEHEQDPATRQTILRALFEVVQFNIGLGGVGLSDTVPGLMTAHATPEERHAVASWVREVIPEKSADSNWSADFRRKEYGALLLELEADILDDETFLAICRETGRIEDAVDRLLERRRVDEAVQEAGQAPDLTLPGIAAIFDRQGHADLGERIVWDRTQTNPQWQLLDWLKARAGARNDAPVALDLALRIFHTNQSLARYQEIRTFARQAGRWVNVRPEVLAALHERRLFALLTQIYLDDGEIDQALAAMRAGPVSASIALEVAKAAEEPRPHDALAIYRRHAEALVGQQGRDNYREACRILTWVRDIYRATGEPEQWTAYITELRERYRRLRAFKEELGAAGL
jgi:hypothetical protein